MIAGGKTPICAQHSLIDGGGGGGGIPVYKNMFNIPYSLSDPNI